MDKKLPPRRRLKSAVSLLLLVTILGASVFPVFANNGVFSGITDMEVEENSLVDLLAGVSAADANGNLLPVSVKSVNGSSGESYADVAVITAGPAGTVYTVEYVAVSPENAEQVYSAVRTVTSIPAEPSEETQVEPEQTEPPEETLPTSETDVPEEESQPEMTVPSLPGETEENGEQQETLPQDAEEPTTDEYAAGEGLPIIFENGLHYVEDPDYPNERIVLYCMNNKLAWPHSTGEHPHVPNYSEGYLTPEQFDSLEQYEECMRKLRKLLFAGYPYNGERLYTIVADAELWVPTEEEFNAMLIVPPQLENDFPKLGHHNFTLADLNDKEHRVHFDDLQEFVQEVAYLLPDGKTASGLTYADITAMPFYKAAFCMTYHGFGASPETVRQIFSWMYSASYFVTETQAYDATQFAVWRLLNAYGVENNDIQTLENNGLAKVLYQYCQHGALQQEEPASEHLSIEGDLTFTYNPKDGMYHSGMLEVVEPVGYNGLYHLLLPEGVTAICEHLTYVYGNEAYELVSAVQPVDGAMFAIRAHIDWLKDMRQYSPIGNTEFQHMIGAVVRKTPVSKITSFTAAKEGVLEISKTVSGNEQDREREFSFVLQLLDAPLSGAYGDLEFHDGKAEFTLKHGETVKAEHLPAGVHYQVTESEAADYQISGTNTEGTVPEDETRTVTFTNTKLNGLLLSKTVGGEMGDKTKPFSFTVEIHTADGTPLQGDYLYTGSVKAEYDHESEAPADGVLTFTDGTASLMLSHGQQIQIKGLPFGCSYKIREEYANEDGYVTTYNGNTAEASGILDASAEVHVVNTKEYVPDTGIRDTETGIAAVIFFAVAGLMLPVVYGLLRRKRNQRNAG